MGKQSPIGRMRALYEQITYHAHKYHVEDAPEIADDVYDELAREFNELCDRHPELMSEFELANKPVPIHDPDGVGLVAVTLSTAMLSAKKANSVQEVHNFMGAFKPGTTFVNEHKIDGLALECRYLPLGENSLLLDRIVTRGAGLIGEDVTHAWPLFAKIRGIPDMLAWDADEYGPMPEEFLVRGEAYIEVGVFERLNEAYEKKKATPRNAVAGWVRALPSNQDKQVLGELLFACYWASVRLDGFSYVKHREKLGTMKLYGPHYVEFQDIVENRRGTVIPIDGIMIKAVQFSEHDRVGTTARWPNFMLAYKFPNEEGQAPMESVEWNTSRLGRVVPTGKYSQVKVGGVMCKSASLDNYSSFMSRGLCVGDIVSITRNNDVIPRINQVIQPGNGALLEAPTECPSCSSLLVVAVGPTSSDLVCNNVSGCPAQLTRRCVNLTDKFGLDIHGLGIKVLGELVDSGVVCLPADLFTTPPGLLLKYVDETTLFNLGQARNQPLWRFIKALGLPDIGIVLAKRIANALSPLWEVPDAVESSLKDVRFLTAIKGISSGTAMKVIRAFDDSTFEENFNKLLANLVINWNELPEGDLRVCITGTFDQSREELIDYFANFDVELTDKLTKDCKFLIIGSKPGKSKLLKATELSIPMLNLEDYSSIDQLIAYVKGN